MLSGGLKVGDRVRIKSKVAALKHRKNKNGKVVHVNGAYILVRPSWTSWEVELYPCELEKL